MPFPSKSETIIERVSDLPPFYGRIESLDFDTFTFEKELQKSIEDNMEVILGIKFLQSEYAAGKKHRDRIDSLGIDENYCPLIIEYKRSTNENLINQGLFYNLVSSSGLMIGSFVSIHSINFGIELISTSCSSVSLGSQLSAMTEGSDPMISDRKVSQIIVRAQFP